MSNKKWMVRFSNGVERIREYFSTKREADAFRKRYGIKAAARRADW